MKFIFRIIGIVVVVQLCADVSTAVTPAETVTAPAAEDAGHERAKECAEALDKVVRPYLDKLAEDVSWFCKKFDYRYENEPWKDSKDAVERTMKFLRSDIHVNEKKKTPGA